MKMVPLGEFMPSRIASVNPTKFLNETFELWSIPAFDAGEPEVILGSNIGSSKKCIEPGDVLLSRIVPHIRRSCVVSPKTSHRQIASGEWITFRGDEFDPNYLRQILITDPFNAEFMQTVAGVGGSLLRARPEGVKRIKIPLPPLEEQKRIAGILDQADVLRRLRTRALDKLNTLGQAIFHEMFGEETPLPRLPLAELIKARSSLADPTLDENAELPHVGPEHISKAGGQIEWSRVNSCRADGVTSGKYRFEPSDVIYSKIRPYLNKVAISDRAGMCSADMYALLPKSDSIKTRYLHFILGSSEFLTYGNSVSGRANIPKMNRKQLMAYEVPLPCVELQEQFEAQMTAIESENTRQSTQHIRFDTLFASLQHRAFRGEL